MNLVTNLSILPSDRTEASCLLLIWGMPHKLDAWSKEFVESYRREKTEKMRQTETERGQKWLTLCSFSFSFPKGYGEWRLGGFFLILPKSNNCLLSWKTKVVKDLSASWWKW